MTLHKIFNLLFFVVIAVVFINVDTARAVPINTEKGWSDSPFMSGDGKRLYFMYSRYSFAQFLKSGGKDQPVLGGPDRVGLHHHENGWGESDTYLAIRNPNGTWQEPVAMGFNGPYGDACGMEFNGGKSFVWLKGDGKVNDIVISHKNADGTWSEPQNLGPKINNHDPEVMQDNPHISNDGNLLWFTSNRPGGLGGKDIWFSQNVDGVWSEPINIGKPFNTPGDEDQMWISSVTADVYWNGPQGIMHCVSDGATCSSTEVVKIPGCSHMAEASVTDDGQRLYFACADAKTFQVKLMYALKQANGRWGKGIPVD